MTEYKPVPVSAAKAIADDFDKDVVIVLAYDETHDMQHTTSYGSTPNAKLLAAELADTITKCVNPDGFTRQIPYEDFRQHRDLPLNEDTRQILGMVNFMAAGYAQTLRKGGMQIPYKSEEEQAAVIWWLLQKYSEHGADWRDVAIRELREMDAKEVAP